MRGASEDTDYINCLYCLSHLERLVKINTGAKNAWTEQDKTDLQILSRTSLQKSQYTRCLCKATASRYDPEYVSGQDG